ncbi:MAG TPA: HDIG domain-containing protein [Tenuifilum sp.]|uniref:HD family phosphohydrolase n=1 Tax=Tenuifilum sp. TaxID=2760880 RepID=UPI002CC8D0C4|nr:HDIG domain-containing protein [Tenuifilum sp.]HQI88480.1 HDIG domain-containing protein [Tenuifilum sp.]
MHEDLYAPFDFPVYKTEQELFAEKSKLLKEFKSFYRYDSTIHPQQLEGFRSSFDLAFDKFINSQNVSKTSRAKYLKVKPELEQFVADNISQIYLKGIINQDESAISNSMLKQGLAVVINNVAYDKWFDEVYTVQKAVKLLNSNANDFTKSLSPGLVGLWEMINLKEYIQPNLFYDEVATQKFRNELISNISITKGLVQAGEKIVVKGEVVNSEIYQILESLKKEYDKRLGSKNLFAILFGNMILIASLYIVLFLFLLNFRNEVLNDIRKLLFILMLITASAAVSALVIKTNSFSIFVIPLAIVPIFVKTFFDSRLALFVHLITIFLVAFLVPNSFEFVFTNFIAGIVAIIGLSKMYNRGQLFKTVGLVYFSYLTLTLSLYLVGDGSLKGVNWFIALWYGINALLLLASYQLVYIIEKFFGFLSDITLIELSDTNLDLLRKLAEVAPGTFQHSLQVANLAESAVQRVGGNPLLVRTGALYHDIGKMANPMFFIENQQGGFNPHENVDNVKSAEIIINHVHEGVKIAAKAGLPSQIVDFIKMHHGTSKVKYFYNKELQAENANIDEGKFSYPGPEPQTKETAIVMMADAVEAASRSLKEYNVQSIDQLVERIIDDQLNSGQYSFADVTLRDISLIKTIFKKKLQNIYHVRLEYPDLSIR